MRHRSVVAALMVCTVVGALPALAQAPARTPGYPGVYVQELPKVPPAIEPAGTSVVAFVGVTPASPKETPVAVTSFADYAAQFGGLDPASPVSFAVRLFFDNGGTNRSFFPLWGRLPWTAIPE